MAFGIGSIFASTFFVKNKKKLIFGFAALVIVGLIYGGMKWDAWRIENLKEDLQKERQANVANKETIEESERLSGIDEQAVMELLDNRDEIRRETDEKITQVVSDVRRILQEERSDREREMDELGQRLEETSEKPVSERVIQSTTGREVDRPVSDRVAERLADGMWDAYCDGVPDDRVCTERQSAAADTVGQTTE